MIKVVSKYQTMVLRRIINHKIFNLERLAFQTIIQRHHSYIYIKTKNAASNNSNIKLPFNKNGCRYIPKRDIFFSQNGKLEFHYDNIYRNGSLFQFNRYVNTENNKNVKDETSNDGNKKRKITLRQLKDMIQVFMFGVKALYNDVKLALKTRRKLGLHQNVDLSGLTREELRHMRQTKKDVAKTFPVTFLFMIPFVGYAAPVLAYFYPKQLLSQQFWHPDQKKEFVLEEYEKRSQYYQPLVKEVGVTAKEIKKKELLRLCYQILDGDHPSNEKLLSVNELFAQNDELSLLKMPRYHLVKLCCCWLIPTAWYLPRWFLMNALTKRISHLHQDDLLIKRDGIDMLTPECIEEAVHVRGLDEKSLSETAKLQWLSEWIDLSANVTSHKISFLAHSAIFKAANFENINSNKKNDNVLENQTTQRIE